MQPPTPPPATRLADHHTYLRARLRALGVAESSLDDAAQDVYEVLIRRIGDYDSRFSLRQWMAGVARKVARRHRDHASRAPLPADEARLPARTPDPEQTTAHRQGLAVLHRFLADLDRDRWAVFVLSEIEGLRGTEIAAELDVNLSTVYARLRTAKQAFVAATAHHRGPGRPWFAALFVDPSSLFRRTTAAGFSSPLALGALALTGAGLLLGARACGEPPPEDPPITAARTPTHASPPTATGIAPRDIDPARLVPATTPSHDGPPPPDADGWRSGGAGFHTGPGAWSEQHSYKLDGPDLHIRITHANDGDLPVHALGWLELDGFDLVDGPSQWPIALAVDTDHTEQWRLRATRPGVVRAPFGTGESRDASTGNFLYQFVLEHAGLRTCNPHECERTLPTFRDHQPGPRIAVVLHNQCGHPIDIYEVPPNADTPPPDAPRHHLATDARRTVEIDSTTKLMHHNDDGAFAGSIGTDSPGAVFRFHGEDCKSSAVDTAPVP